MQDAKPPSKRGKGQAAKQANAGLKQRSAQARRPRPAPSPGFLEDILSEAARAPAQAARAGTPNRGGKPATRQQIERGGDRAQERFKRTQALKPYTSASRAERSRMVAAVEARAAKGRASDQDRLIMQTHSRRVAQSAGKAAKVNAANARHDAAVASRQANDAVNDLLERFGRSRFTDAKPNKSTLAQLADSLIGEGTSDLAGKAGRAALDAGGDAITGLGDLRADLQRRNGSPLERQALRAGAPDDGLEEIR